MRAHECLYRARNSMSDTCCDKDIRHAHQYSSSCADPQVVPIEVIPMIDLQQMNSNKTIDSVLDDVCIYSQVGTDITEIVIPSDDQAF